MKLISILLSPLSWLYGIIVWSRNTCYDAHLLQIYHVDIPVISVGNITVGGTGKTPFVELLVRKITGLNKKIAVVSRGYKRTSKGTVVVSDGKMLRATVQDAGDEPYQIALKFPGAVVIVDERRSRGAQLAVESYRAEVIILDDGFQHRSVYRDLDIVMIDGQQSLSSTSLLPSGLRREPLSSLHRAHLFAVLDSHDLSTLRADLNKSGTASSIEVRRVPKVFVSLRDNREIRLPEIYGKSCVAFCGIGNPDSFRNLLEGAGMHVREFMRFPDHHRFSLTDIRRVEDAFTASKTDMLVTTEKDAIRLKSWSDPQSTLFQHCFFPRIELEIIQGADILQDALEALLGKAA